MNRPERMGHEPMLKLIVSFALPSIAGMVANSLYNIVDRMFVGRIVGAKGLAAISVCFPFMMLGVSLCLLIGVGAAPLISMALGEEDRSKAERVLGNAIGALLGIGGMTTLLGFANMDLILSSCGAGPDVLPTAREYLRVILLGVPFFSMAFGLNFCIRAEGRPRFAMGTQVLGALVNIVLDALFIGVLRMGVAGAAWGTVIAQIVSMGWVLSFYFRRKGVLRLHPRNCLPRAALLRRIATLGLSPCLTELSFSFFFVLFNRALRTYGGDLAVSAIGIFTGWDSLLFLPVIGIAEATQTLFAYNWGAHKIGRVLEALKWALSLASGYFALSVLGVYFFVDPMMRCFTSDLDLLELATEGMRISYAAVLFAGIGLIGAGFFQGLGRAKLSLALTLSRHLLFLIPSIWILPPLLGVRGVWFCFPAVDVGGGLLALFLLLRYYKKLGLASLDRRDG